MDPDDLADGQPSPFAVGSVYPPSQGATNPQLAAEFLQQHRQAMAQRQPDIDQTLGKMQLSTDSMTKLLDDTTAAIKSVRQNQSSLPLMAMAAGMLSSRGNFGNQLGAGLSSVIPTIQKDRESDEQMNLQLANLGLKKASLAEAPLQAKLAYMRALQTGDINATRAIEQALIRSQGQGGSNSPGNPKLIQKTVQDALSEARKQVDSMGKEMFATSDEREAEIKRRFAENIKVARSSGIQIPADVETTILGTGALVPGSAMQTRKSYFDAPGPDTLSKIQDAGLPAPPTGYIYQSIGPQDRPKMLMEQSKNFQKETKDFDDTSSTQRTLLDQIDQIERILDKHPEVVGPRKGIIPNKYAPNLTESAQTLNGLFNAMQLHSVPKGQGAVSNMERDLFASASPNMSIGADANKNLLGIQKNIANRDKDRREFFNEYFNNYRTTDGMVSSWDRYINSPSGSAFTRDQDGTPVPNKSRMPWRDFFKSEHADAGNRARGGYIKLGDEYDHG